MPLTGRITEFIPFLTFSPGEQAVVAHKYLTEFGQEIAQPVSLSDDEKRDRLVGDIDLRVSRDYSLCRVIARDYYDQQLGARSVIEGVERMVRSEVLDHYIWETDEPVRDGQGRAEYRAEVNADDEVEVCRVLEVGENEGDP